MKFCDADINQALRIIFGDDFDPEYRRVIWAKQAIETRQLLVFPDSSVQSITLSKFVIDPQTLNGSFRVSVNDVELEDRFYCWVQGDGWLDYQTPYFLDPVATQGAMPAYFFPDTVREDIRAILRSIIPKVRPWGLDKSTGVMTTAQTPLSERIFNADDVHQATREIMAYDFCKAKTYTFQE